MNKIIMIGRLVADPELRYTTTGKAVTNFTLAVNRQFSKEKKADFFRIVVWGKQAENVSKYLKKGAQCAVEGSVQIEQYEDKEGNVRYSTDIIASYVEFLGGDKQDFPKVEIDEIPF